MNGESEYRSLLSAYCSKPKLEFFRHASDLINRSSLTMKDVFSTAITVASEDSDKLNRKFRGRDWDDRNALVKKTEFEIQESERELPLRICLKAKPGGGKTALCQRLTLAYLTQEYDFLQKYLRLVPKDQNQLPVFLPLKKLGTISLSKIKALDFFDIAYFLNKEMLGEEFSKLVFSKEFRNLLQNRSNNGQLMLFLDAWDEILDGKKERIILEKLQAFLVQHPQTNVMVTVRNNFRNEDGSVFDPFAADTCKLCIPILDDNAIHQFCKDWYSLMYNDPQLQMGYTEIVRQMKLKYYSGFINDLTSTPLNLSMVLSVSVLSQHLPANKYSLFEKYSSEMLTWYRIKNTGTELPEDVVISFLAYIAFCMVKKNRIECTFEQLVEWIGQSLEDLDGYFPVWIEATMAKEYAQELLRTSILEMNERRKVSFFHRQLLEYFAAYAVRSQCCTSEYNSKSAHEILREHYCAGIWNEITLFAAGGDNTLAFIIIRDLMEVIEKDADAFSQTNLLYSMVRQSVRLPRHLKEQAYSLIFRDSITDDLIEKTNELASIDSSNTLDFKAFIKSKFEESCKNNDSEFGYCYALILSHDSHQQGRLPLEDAETLLLSDNITDQIAAMQIYTVLGWCKQVNIPLPFENINYHMSLKAQEALKTKIQDTEFPQKNVLFPCFKDCVLAGYITFKEIVDDIDSYIERWVNGDSFISALLSVGTIPVPGTKRKCNAELREKQINKLREQIATANKEDAIFTFGICASLGCFETEEALRSAYVDTRTLYPAELDYDLPSELVRTQLPSIHPRTEAEARAAQLDRVLGAAISVTVNNTTTYKACVPRTDGEIINASDDEHTICGKLADVLRRNPSCFIWKDNQRVGMQELLLPGLEAKNCVCLITHALCLSGVSNENVGDITVGCQFLKQSQIEAVPDHVINRHFFRAFFHDMVEGFAVLSWLEKIGVISEKALRPNPMFCPDYERQMKMLNEFREILASL